MGRICVCNVNNSQVAWAGGHSIINVPPHSWHPTQGYIPGVMGSSWTEVSWRTAENQQTGRQGLPRGTPTIITPLGPKPAPCWPLPSRRSLPARKSFCDAYLQRKQGTFHTDIAAKVRHFTLHKTVLCCRLCLCGKNDSTFRPPSFS